MLGPGPLTAPLTALAPGRQVWLDGGHNPDAGMAIAQFFGSGESARTTTRSPLTKPGRTSPEPVEASPLHLVIGMLANKDPAAIVAPLAGKLLSVSVVPAPGHDAHTPEDFAAHTDLPVRSFPDVPTALAALPPEGDVLIAGSLYLAGEVLRLNREIPD